MRHKDLACTIPAKEGDSVARMDCDAGGWEVIEVKTAELIGLALDWAVAKAAGWPVEIKPHGQYSNASTGHKLKARSYRLWMVSDVEPEECTPSSDWAQGGPLIEKYRVWLSDRSAGNQSPADEWVADVNGPKNMECWQNYYVGQSPLIAACRAIVAAELGDAVSVPSELVQP